MDNSIDVVRLDKSDAFPLTSAGQLRIGKETVGPSQPIRSCQLKSKCIASSPDAGGTNTSRYRQAASAKGLIGNPPKNSLPVLERPYRKSLNFKQRECSLSCSTSTGHSIRGRYAMDRVFLARIPGGFPRCAIRWIVADASPYPQTLRQSAPCDLACLLLRRCACRHDRRARRRPGRCRSMGLVMRLLPGLSTSTMIAP